MDMSLRQLIALAMSLSMVGAMAAPPPGLFDDKPYTIDTAPIQALDPKPLDYQIMKIDPAQPDRLKGLRMVSKGRVFPTSYEVISVIGAKSEVLDAMSASFDGHDDIVLKGFVRCHFSDHCLHWFEQDSVNGKPHHVSSNYAFMKDDVMFHFAGTSYAAGVMGRTAWPSPPTADANAEREVQLLLNATTLK